MLILYLYGCTLPICVLAEPCIVRQQRCVSCMLLLLAVLCIVNLIWTHCGPNMEYQVIDTGWRNTAGYHWPEIPPYDAAWSWSAFVHQSDTIKFLIRSYCGVSDCA